MCSVLKSVWNNRNVSMETKRGMYEGMEDERLVKKIYRTEVEGNRGEVDQRESGWME